MNVLNKLKFDNERIISSTPTIGAFYLTSLTASLPFAIFTKNANMLAEPGFIESMTLAVLLILAYSFFVEFFLCKDWPDNTGHELTFKIYRKVNLVMLVLSLALILYGFLILIGLQNISSFYHISFSSYLGLCLMTWYFRHEMAKAIKQKDQDDQAQ